MFVKLHEKLKFCILFQGLPRVKVLNQEEKSLHKEVFWEYLVEAFYIMIGWIVQ